MMVGREAHPIGQAQVFWGAVRLDLRGHAWNRETVFANSSPSFAIWKPVKPCSRLTYLPLTGSAHVPVQIAWDKMTVRSTLPILETYTAR